MCMYFKMKADVAQKSDNFFLTWTGRGPFIEKILSEKKYGV